MEKKKRTFVTSNSATEIENIKYRCFSSVCRYTRAAERGMELFKLKIKCTNPSAISRSDSDFPAKGFLSSLVNPTEPVQQVDQVPKAIKYQAITIPLPLWSNSRTVSYSLIQTIPTFLTLLTKFYILNSNCFRFV